MQGSAEDAFAPPQPGFHISSVHWPVDELETALSLEPFRESFRGVCHKTRALDAAQCISDRMARQFQHGEPGEEFVASSFEPARHLRTHSGGTPGHCVNRSAILAAELLSVGFPARVVQLAPLNGNGGHNLVEVFDEERGWIMVDPTYGGLAGDANGPGAALALSGSPERVVFYPRGVAPSPFESIEVAEVEAIYRAVLPAAVVYPEPWLYLRVGERHAPWPFRGTYLQTGASTFAIGRAQRWLRITIPLTTAVTVGLLVFAAFGSIRERRAATPLVPA